MQPSEQWPDYVQNDFDAVSLDQQIAMLEGSIAELGQKRYLAMTNAAIFRSPDQTKVMNEASDGIAVIRKQLALIRRKQADRIRQEAHRVRIDALAAIKELADAKAAITEAQAELESARKLQDEAEDRAMVESA